MKEVMLEVLVYACIQIAMIWLLTRLVDRRTNKMSQQLEDLKAAVEKQTSINESAVTLIKGLADKLNAAKDDPDAIEALAAQLNHSSDDLAAAISANTVAQQASAGDPEPSGTPI